jgi:hypothetical protein
MPKLLIKRKSYTRKDGTRVKAATFKVADKGAPGRTPKSERWYSPKVRTGWSKNLSPQVRRTRVLRTHKGDVLAAARSMLALSNVTNDLDTRHKSAVDAKYFFKKNESK